MFYIIVLRHLSTLILMKKKIFRKDSEVNYAERSSLSLNNRLVWIPGKSNTFKHNNSELN